MNIIHYVFGSKVWNKIFKNSREIACWKKKIDRMVRWYNGVEKVYGYPFPAESEKEKRFDSRTNAIMTFIAVENDKATYLSDLRLSPNLFTGKRVADIGSGPLPTLLVFNDCERYCIDHLIEEYIKIGYPLHKFKPEITFVKGKAEKIPVPDMFFDVVISRNALDHLDDFGRAASEIKRVLGPGGVLHFSVNYHMPTSAEPRELNDGIILEHFGGLGIQKAYEQKGAYGFEQGVTVLWSNLL